MGWDGDGYGVMSDRVGSVGCNLIFLAAIAVFCSPYRIRMISYLLFLVYIAQNSAVEGLCLTCFALGLGAADPNSTHGHHLPAHSLGLATVETEHFNFLFTRSPPRNFSIPATSFSSSRP